MALQRVQYVSGLMHINVEKGGIWELLTLRENVYCEQCYQSEVI